MSIVTKSHSVVFVLLLVIIVRSLESLTQSHSRKYYGKDLNDVIFGDYITFPPNTTSCQEFLRDSTLDVNKVIDIDWKIFYFWNHGHEDSYNIRFTLPPESLIKRFQVALDPEISKAVNWSMVEMFMETEIDFSALYIRTEIPGLYEILPSQLIQYPDIRIPPFALKLVEPGYLGVLNCRYRDGYALAPADKIPNEKNLTAAAQSLGVWSPGHSYLMKDPADVYVKHSHTNLVEDDADDDVDQLVEAEAHRRLL